MGARSIGTQVLEKYRQAFTVPATAGLYAFERITFGKVPCGVAELTFTGITAVAETANLVADAIVELWLPRLADSSKQPCAFVDSDYTYSGESFTMTSGNPGAETWALAGYPGGQIRVKSGGTSGSAVVSATGI